MKWTRPGDLRAQVQKMWERGELLSGFVTGEPPFPKRLTIKVPTSAEVSARFDEVRIWSNELRAMPRCRVEMREFKHRVFGTNALPQEVWVETVDDALALIGKERAAARFAELIKTTRRDQPQLLDWLDKRPLRALELFDEWSRLLAIVSWVEKHPRAGVYVRQVDIPGVHSKFIEAQRGVLMELLDLVLRPEVIDFTANGVSHFARRYGFLDKPLRIRFRLLDRNNALLPGDLLQDITLDVASFSQLTPEISRVFITENEINFLAFPPLPESMVIFGAGYGFEMLRQAQWLVHCRIHYWGDIDTHGFAILDQLRSQFDHVESFLMDRSTLLAFKLQWGEEQKPTLRDLSRLTLDEQALYNDLRDNRLQKKLRLEQEKVGFSWVESALSAFS